MSPCTYGNARCGREANREPVDLVEGEAGSRGPMQAAGLLATRKMNRQHAMRIRFKSKLELDDFVVRGHGKTVERLQVETAACCLEEAP